MSAMASAEDHRRNASECLRMARQTADPAAKALLLTMAERWLRLAQEMEKADENSN
jgi:hydroxyacyl-ACP dehydratase HTD2-like protein with hotdog domain